MLVLVIEIVKGSRQNECLANFAQRDRFRRIAERGLKRSMGSRNGSKLSRNV
jgi:hypothetical protein